MHTPNSQETLKFTHIHAFTHSHTHTHIHTRTHTHTHAHQTVENGKRKSERRSTHHIVCRCIAGTANSAPHEFTTSTTTACNVQAWLTTLRKLKQIAHHPMRYVCMYVCVYIYMYIWHTALWVWHCDYLYDTSSNTVHNPRTTPENCTTPY